MITSVAGCLIFIGAVVNSSYIYDHIITEYEDGLLNYTTDFWPNPLPDPWNESLF